MLVEFPNRREPLEVPKRKWEDGIKIDPREADFGSVDYAQLAAQVAGFCGLSNEPCKNENFLISRRIIKF
jgi:hypothetical protein